MVFFSICAYIEGHYYLKLPGGEARSRLGGVSTVKNLGSLPLSILLCLSLAACSDDGETQEDSGVTKKDGPAVKKDGPAVKKDGSTVKKDGPVVKKDGPIVKKDGPAVKKDGPAVKKDGPVVKKDGPIVKKDGPLPQPDKGTPKPDAAVFSCPPLGVKKLAFKSSGAGDWVVGLEPKTVYKQATLTGSGPMAKYAAAAADYKQNCQQVAGFV